MRISCNEPEDKINHINDIVGDEISVRSACRLLETLNERDLITERERLLIEIALKNQSSNHNSEDTANLLKKMLNALISIEI